jgi:dsRNA-specific ribonuclease
MSENFKLFLENLLRRAKVKEEYIELFLTPKNLEEFQVAFTHPSYDSPRDFQLYEYLGDVVINEFIPFYIRWRFPTITRVKWCTRIKTTMMSSKLLARIVKEHGIDKFIRYGQDMKDAMAEEPNLDENDEYIAMLQDSMEGFFGCLSTIIINSGKEHGTSTQISHLILRSLYDNVKISTSYDEIFDPVTRLKDFYSSRELGIKWPGQKMYDIQRIDQGENVLFKITVIGWPKGDLSPKDANMAVLSSVTHKDKKKAKMKAAADALQTLATTYKLVHIPFDFESAAPTSLKGKESWDATLKEKENGKAKNYKQIKIANNDFSEFEYND